MDAIDLLVLVIADLTAGDEANDGRNADIDLPAVNDE